MSDKIELRIGDYIYRRFKNYQVDSDIYEAADAFQFELCPDSNFSPRAGMKCEFFVNGELELTGIIDKATRGYDSRGRVISISGRDTMSLIVDSYVETYATNQNTSLKKVAEKLLKKVPFIKSIEYDTGAEKRDATKPFIQTEPGQKIFDVLRDVAASRGLMFYSKPNGGLVFRKPRGRSGQTLFAIRVNKSEQNNIVIKATLSEDISQRYSRYTVLTQEQGEDEEPPQINAIATVEDDQFPFRDTLYKPFVEAVSDDAGSPKKLAQLRMEHARMISNTLSYTVKGHSQNIRNWAIDELVRVDDYELDVHADMLIYGRTFSGAENGQITELKLGVPGLVA